MYELLFATNNAHKVQEIQPLLPADIKVLSLKDAGIDVDIEEPYETLEENAVEKASVIHALTGKNCFSEDTGLEVEALNGAPGVRSARYAGDKATHAENIDLLLTNLEGNSHRAARFRTVIALQWNETMHLFEGICPGTIISEKQGEKGFGYDPIFIPDGADKTFGEMSATEKAQFSHRAKALEKLIYFLTHS